jgi:chromosome partitioning protein
MEVSDVKVVTVGNMAGSAGKTVTVTSLATLLAAEGKRVLVIDADRQGNATRWLNVDPDLHRSFGYVLMRHTPILDAIIYDTSAPGVACLASCKSFDDDVRDLDMQLRPDYRVVELLSEIEDLFDVVLIDTAGNLATTLPIMYLAASTAAIAVTSPGDKEIDGVPPFAELASKVGVAYRTGLTCGAVVPCIVPPARDSKRSQELLDGLRSKPPFADLVTPPVRRTTARVGESYAARIPLPLFYPREPVTQDYRDVLAWLHEHEVL